MSSEYLWEKFALIIVAYFEKKRSRVRDRCHVSITDTGTSLAGVMLMMLDEPE